MFFRDVIFHDGMFLLPLDITREDMRSESRLSPLGRTDYRGEFDFDEGFLNVLSKGEIRKKNYYYFYSTKFEDDGLGLLF